MLLSFHTHITDQVAKKRTCFGQFGLKSDFFRKLNHTHSRIRKFAKNTHTHTHTHTHQNNTNPHSHEQKGGPKFNF